MRSQVRRLALYSGLAILAASTAPAQPTPDSWVGRQVVTTERTPIRVGRKVVDDGRMHRVYQVERAEMGELWLVSGRISGWIPASNAIPVEQALDHFTEVIFAHPESPHAYLRRAAIWHDNRYFDNAIADLTEAIRLDPTEALAFHNRGWNWWEKKEYDKAIADYDEAIRLDPKSVLTYSNRGGLWHDKKEYGKSIADLSIVVRLDPKNAFAYNSRAWIWGTCPDKAYRDGKKAVESATRACVLTDWKNADGLGTLAAAYAETGEFAKAVQWQTKANTLYQDEVAQRLGRERLVLYQGETPYRAKR